MCYLNFPRCDSEDKTLIMCRSACENLMRACHYQKDMQRCGPSEWVNGVDGPEIPTLNDETGLYDIRIRGFFLGQPFRDYEEECTESINGKECEATVVCTPSLVNRANRVTSITSVFNAMALCFVSVIWLLSWNNDPQCTNHRAQHNETICAQIMRSIKKILTLCENNLSTKWYDFRQYDFGNYYTSCTRWRVERLKIILG